MLAKSDTSIPEVMKAFATYGQEACYIVPTDTGMIKSILDAHASLRDFLRIKKIHDFNNQEQGGGSKKVVNVFLVGVDSIKETKMSLYRPETKSGDPRLWIYGLNDYASPYNLLAFIEVKGHLYVINASNKDLLHRSGEPPLDMTSNGDLSVVPQSPLESILLERQNNLAAVEIELLDKLRFISARGFIDSLRVGDTGVGMTLETLLGIQANSSRAPDYFGIEIKAKRVSGRRNRSSTKATLFSQVPDWNISECRNGLAILKKFGYTDSITNRLQLYCTNSNRPNPQGLYLQVDEDAGLLKSLKNNINASEQVVAWRLEKLRKELEAKHKKTFWVKARNQLNCNGVEQFHYVEVEHTESPLSANLATLIEIGAVTMDYTLSEKENGRSARDHGYLFRILPSNFDLLFPRSKLYPLN